MMVAARAAERRRVDALDDDKVRRFFDRRLQKVVVKVLPGEHYMSSRPNEVLVTILGSCVSACVRDPAHRIGGMNHFMLPHSENGNWGKASAHLRYGNYAMEVLLNKLIARGCPRAALEIKVFGGANVMSGMSSVGAQNAEFVTRYLKEEGYRVAAVDLGGDLPRRIHFDPTTGKARHLYLKRAVDKAVFRRERDFGKRMEHTEVEGDVELFT